MSINNLVIGGDFEQGFEYWTTSTGLFPKEDSNNTSYPPGNSEMYIEEDPSYSDGKFLHFIPNDSFYLYSTYKGEIRINPGKYYIFSFKMKAPSTHEVIGYIYDSDFSYYKTDGTISVSKKIGSIREFGYGVWKECKTIIYMPSCDELGDSLENHRIRIYLYGTISGNTKEESYIDSVQLYEYDAFVPSLVNISSDSCKKIIFSDSGDINTNLITYRGEWSEIKSENSIDGEIYYYREILNNKEVFFEIPVDGFSIGEDDYPINNFILEIKFKNDSEVNNLHYLYSKIDYFAELDDGSLDNRFYKNADPNNIYSDKEYKQIGRFYKPDKDSLWRLIHIPLRNNRFKLLKNIDGKFKFKITTGTDISLKISHIAIREASLEECEQIILDEASLNGYYEMFLPEDGREKNIQYDNNCVIFVRDNIRPIYEHTKPSLEEISDKIIITSYGGETEAANFGIYSVNGTKINISISDLLSTNSFVPSSNIEIFEVKYGYSRQTPQKLSYAKVEDRIEKNRFIDIPSNTSKRIWLKIHIPENSLAARYEGNITIKYDNGFVKNIKMVVKVLAVSVKESIVPVFTTSDPFRKVFFNRTSETIKFFKDYKLDIYFYLQDERNFDFDKQTGKFDLTKFDELYIFPLIEGGAINLSKKNGNNKTEICLQILNIYSWIDNSVTNHYFFYSVNPNLWFDMISSPTMDSLESFYDELRRIQDKYGLEFVIFMSDEPGNDPYKRILCDRAYTVARYFGFRTAVTYNDYCDEIIEDTGIFQTDDGTIPPLTNLIDYKIWSPSNRTSYYNKHQDSLYYGKLGYYTTYSSNLRNPLYNRFLHGIMAYAYGARNVLCYALGDFQGDPFNDFDRRKYVSQDFFLAYPTNDGSNEFIPNFGAEGIREGIKDLNLLYTLEEKLITHIDHPLFMEIIGFLNRIRNGINKDFYYGYFSQGEDIGYYKQVLRDLSQISGNEITNKEEDYESFSRIINTVKGYIMSLDQDSYYIVRYNTSTVGSPPFIRCIYTDSEQFSDITEIQLSWEEEKGTDITDWVVSFKEGDLIKIVNSTSSIDWGMYKINSISNFMDNQENPYISLNVLFQEGDGVEYVRTSDDLMVSHYNNPNPGIDGTSGTSGTSGVDGTSGTSGTSGVDGTSGTSGTSGVDGTSGTSGVDGTSGTSGVGGSSGVPGSSGTSGTSGTSGVDGSSGIPGSSGTSGTSGSAGASGSSGTSGTSGSAGASGSSGTSGTNGIDGSSGTSGTSGTSGKDGTSVISFEDKDKLIFHLEQIVQILKGEEISSTSSISLSSL